MKTFNEWEHTKRFYELNSNPMMAPEATPQPTTAAPMQQVHAMNSGVDLSQLGGAVGQYMSQAGKALETKNVNFILRVQSEFNNFINQLLQEKGAGAARRGARAGLNVARQINKMPVQKPMS